MHFDIHFWEGVCFFLFVALAYKPIKNILVNYLNEYSSSIATKIKDAENLSEEAKKIFKYYTEQHKTFIEKISSMRRHTEENIKVLKDQAAKTLDEKIKVRQQLQKEKLDLYEKKEQEQIKETIIRKAVVLAVLYVEDVIVPDLKKDDIIQLLDVIKDKSITFH